MTMRVTACHVSRGCGRVRGPTLTETRLFVARWPGVRDIGVPGPGPGTGGDTGGSPEHPAQHTLPAHPHPPHHTQHGSG